MNIGDHGEYLGYKWKISRVFEGDGDAAMILCVNAPTELPLTDRQIGSLWDMRKLPGLNKEEERKRIAFYACDFGRYLFEDERSLIYIEDAIQRLIVWEHGGGGEV